MTVFLDLLLIALLGALLGCATGLLPSLHVNTLAVLLLAAAPLLGAVLVGMGLVSAPAGLLVAAFVLAISIAHTFVNIIPATYLGAPDETSALAVLPGHQMLLRGTGFRAVHLSALASQAAVLASVALAVPFQWWLAGPPSVWESVRANLFWFVLALALLLVALEPNPVGPASWPKTTRQAASKAVALGLLALTALYGLLLDELPYRSLVPVPPSPLLPALGGLFGGATILTSLVDNAKIPHQFLRVRHRDIRLSGAVPALAAGVAAGATMSVLPGLTNASATALAATLRRGTNEETVVTLSAVNTANAVFNLVVLYLFGRTRSGAVVAMKDLWPVDPWFGTVPADLLAFGVVAIATGLLSMLITIGIGRYAVRSIQRVPYRALSWAVLAYMIATVCVFTGAAGLLVFAVGLALGALPVRLGIRRVALTGVLLGPVLVYLAPAALGLR